MPAAKQVSLFFLLQRRPEPDWSRGRRTAFWLWNWILLLGAAAVLGLVSLALAPANYGWPIFFDYLSSPALLTLNLLPVLLCAALLYGLTGRPWLAYLITAIPVLALSVGNYYKLAFRDDPVVASDLLILAEAGKMAGQYHLFLAVKIVAALAAGVVSVILLALLARGLPRRAGRISAALVSLALAGALVPAYGSDRIYSATENAAHINQWAATQQYISRGLLYPFLHSVKDALPNPPADYSRRDTAQLLAQYGDGDIPEDQKVNIVGIMLEAFADFSVYDQIEFRQDVYQVYHQLEAESYTGSLLTNIFAGGTVNTERAFLTGISSGDHNYRGNTSSYVRYLKAQGYQASGDHPSNNWFYNRQNVNEYLGFDQYRFVEDYYTQFTGGGTANDSIFFPELTQSILEQMESDSPLFSFSVSYQGHGPYSGEQCWWGAVDDFIGNEELDQASRTILANYFGSVQNTQQYLADMVDTFRHCDEPVVLVIFGDHKPWLGNNSTVYSALGIALSNANTETFYNYWSTRYLIWANDAAKEALGNDFVGTGPDISPCFLMNLLFEQCGWQGDAYMQAVYDCWQALPTIHTSGLYLTSDGILTAQLSDTQQELARRFAWLEYYRSTNFAD